MSLCALGQEGLVGGLIEQAAGREDWLQETQYRSEDELKRLQDEQDWLQDELD